MSDPLSYVHIVLSFCVIIICVKVSSGNRGGGGGWLTDRSKKAG